MPEVDSLPTAVLEIAEVKLVDGIVVQLTDLRMYAIRGGQGLNPRSRGFIVPATVEHWTALNPVP